MVMNQIMTQCNGFLVTLYSQHIGTLLKHIYCDKGVLLKANAAYYTQAFFLVWHGLFSYCIDKAKRIKPKTFVLDVD